VTLLIGLAAIAGLIIWQIRAIVQARHPGLRAVETLAVVIPTFLLLFAAGYFLASEAQPAVFSEPMTRTDALYFTITVFATVGFGDISPVSEGTRIVVSIQMLADLLLLGLVLQVFSARCAEGRRAPASRRVECRRANGRAAWSRRVPLDAPLLPGAGTAESRGGIRRTERCHHPRATTVGASSRAGGVSLDRCGGSRRGARAARLSGTIGRGLLVERSLALDFRPYCPVPDAR
jgi:Ion channel